VPLPGPLTLLKVDETSAFQHLHQNQKKSNIAMNINRVCFAGNLTAESELNFPPKGTEFVS
jgi:hypothetical protein